MKRTFLVFVAVACSAAASGAYTTGFENPPFTGSAGGDLITGVDGWYLPPAAGSLDWRTYTYAGNTLGFSTLPVVGQLQFAGGMSDDTSTGYARMQRDENFDASDTW